MLAYEERFKRGNKCNGTQLLFAMNVQVNPFHIIGAENLKDNLVDKTLNFWEQYEMLQYLVC